MSVSLNSVEFSSENRWVEFCLYNTGDHENWDKDLIDQLFSLREEYIKICNLQ